MADNNTSSIKEKNGVYKWKYEVNLFKDLSIFWLVCKVLVFTILGVWLVFFLLLNLIEGTLIQNLTSMFQMLGIMFAIMGGLAILGYLLYAAIMGGKYKVNFTMDEEKIVHAQSADQAKKAEGISTATAIVGLLAKNPTTVGVGLNSGRTSMTTYFEGVKRVRVKRRKNTIALGGGGTNNVYASDEDFDFVRDYIRAHVPETVDWRE